LRDPIYGRPCVHYDILVWRRGKEHRILWREQSEDPFDIEDGTGKTTVLAKDATWVPAPGARAARRSVAAEILCGYTNDPASARYLETAVQRGAGILPDNVLVTAAILRPAQKVCVAGWVGFTRHGLALRKRRFEQLVIAPSPDAITKRRITGVIFTIVGGLCVGFGIVLGALAILGMQGLG
jgi:hypothetical protein